MDGRRGKAEDPLVRLGEELEQLDADVREREVERRDAPDHVRCRQRAMGRLERDHGDRKARFEDQACRLRIGPDVELGGGGNVPKTDCAAHQHEPPESLRQAWVALQGGGHVGERAGGDQDEPLVPLSGVEDHIDGVAGVKPDRRRPEGRAVEARLAVNLRRRDPAPDQWSIATRGDRDVTDVRHAADAAGVERGLVEALVAGHGRDRDQLQRGSGQRVVVAWVAVQHDRLPRRAAGAHSFL